MTNPKSQMAMVNPMFTNRNVAENAKADLESRGWDCTDISCLDGETYGFEAKRERYITKWKQRR
jgi:hypothetical protein